MTDETKLKQIYQAVSDAWHLYKANAGKPDKDWDAIVAQADRILNEAGKGRSAWHIITGFLGALEEEDKQYAKQRAIREDREEENKLEDLQNARRSALRHGD